MTTTRKRFQIELSSEDEETDDEGTGWEATIVKYDGGFVSITVQVQVSDGDFEATHHNLFTAANQVMEALPGSRW